MLLTNPLDAVDIVGLPFAAQICRELPQQSVSTHRPTPTRNKQSGCALSPGADQWGLNDAWLDVIHTSYTRHKSKDKYKPDTLRVTYKCHCENSPMNKRYVSEWICIEHTGFGRRKAEEWIESVTDQEKPRMIDDMLDLIQQVGIAQTGSGKTVAFLLPLLCYLQQFPRLNEETARVQMDGWMDCSEG